MLSLLFLPFLGGPLFAERGGAYSYSLEDTVIGLEGTYVIRGDETLLEVARLFDLGYNEMVEANPGIDPWVPPRGTVVRVPTMWVLPDVMEEGIVINLAEMRLYYFFTVKGQRMVRTFPIGIGRKGLSTPLGMYRIVAKVKDPVWYPPEEARREDPTLPPYVPPGPGNPLGGYWLQLSIPGYGIHGTNRPWGIGRRVSRGCIRLYPEDIAWLFEHVRVGTKVKIVNKPVKIGQRDGRLYIEIHPGKVDLNEVIESIKKAGGPALKRENLQPILQEADGVPFLLTSR